MKLRKRGIELSPSCFKIKLKAIRTQSEQTNWIASC